MEQTQVDKDREQLAEALGLKSYPMKVNGGDTDIVLRPLSLAAQVELANADFANDTEETLRALFLSAKRGGYNGTEAELAELFEGDEILEAAEALQKLAPLSVKLAQARLAPRAPEAEAGTESSGGSSSPGTPSET